MQFEFQITKSSNNRSEPKLSFFFLPFIWIKCIIVSTLNYLNLRLELLSISFKFQEHLSIFVRCCCSVQCRKNSSGEEKHKVKRTSSVSDCNFGIFAATKCSSVANCEYVHLFRFLIRKIFFFLLFVVSASVI